MTEAGSPVLTDAVSQVQEQLSGVTSLLYNFIGATQRDAGPVSIKDEVVVHPSTTAPPPIDLMAEQLTEGLKALRTVIEALPDKLPSEQERLVEVLRLQRENVQAAAELQEALTQAKTGLGQSQQVYDVLADAVLLDVSALSGT